jgi:hypothetical protein
MCASELDFVNGQQLCDLLKDHQLGIRQAVVVDADWSERI